MEWGLPHRGRISPEEAAYVREHLDEVQQLRLSVACRCWIRPTPGQGALWPVESNAPLHLLALAAKS